MMIAYHSIKFRSTPLNDLFEPSVILPFGSFSNETRIRHEQYALTESLNFTILEFAQLINPNVSGSNILQISFRIVHQVVGHGDPKGFLPFAQVVFIDNSSNGATLSNASSVTYVIKSKLLLRAK